jgi:aminopeptidase YwaD
MVGEDQKQTGSSWLIERPPDAAASFAPELLAILREQMVALKGMVDVSPSHTGVGEFPLYRQAESAFSGGSDHYILSDPTVGVPTPMLIQWPDRFYHTSADTPSRTDPRSLARSGALAAAYAYWLASAEVVEAAELGYEMVARFKAELVNAAQSAVAEAMQAEDSDQLTEVLGQLDRLLAYRLDRQKAALRTLERLAPLEYLATDLQSELDRTGEQETAWAQGAMDLAWTGFSELGKKRRKREPGEAVEPAQPRRVTRESAPGEREAAGLVPVRRVRGPVPFSDHLWKLDPVEREGYLALLVARKGANASTLTTLALYWADGRRTALEIVNLVELEAGERDVELLVGYFRLLERLGFVTLQQQAG